MFLWRLDDMYVKKKIGFEYRTRFEKSIELLTIVQSSFERLMCEVEFWEVLEKMCKGFLDG